MLGIEVGELEEPKQPEATSAMLCEACRALRSKASFPEKEPPPFQGGFTRHGEEVISR